MVLLDSEDAQYHRNKTSKPHVKHVGSLRLTSSISVWVPVPIWKPVDLDNWNLGASRYLKLEIWNLRPGTWTPKRKCKNPDLSCVGSLQSAILPLVGLKVILMLVMMDFRQRSIGREPVQTKRRASVVQLLCVCFLRIASMAVSQPAGVPHSWHGIRRIHHVATMNPEFLQG